jgi:hypothetical protein
MDVARCQPKAKATCHVVSVEAPKQRNMILVKRRRGEREDEECRASKGESRIIVIWTEGLDHKEEQQQVR